MELITPFLVFFSVSLLFLFLFLGFIFGWIVNSIVTSIRDNPINKIKHPEMFDEHGNLMPDELIAFTFENYDYEEDYDDD
jgi:hypothetical protein